ncbi:hypothetical protein D3C84_228420 [compost metagenome]
MCLPIVDQLLHLGGDFILIQRRELPVETNHRNQRPTILLEQYRINPRPAPGSLGEGLQRQHPQGRKICAAVAESGVMGRCPLPLPDVELLIQRWRVLSFATAEQRQRRKQNDRASEKNHEKRLSLKSRKGLLCPLTV